MIPLTESTADGAQQPPPPRRTYRMSDGHLVFPVWYTIRDLEHKGVIADVDNIASHLLHMDGCSTEVLNRNGVAEALGRMTEDGLLLEESDDQEMATYSLPVNDSELHSKAANINGIVAHDSCSISRFNNRDTYCYECHRAGSVLDCSQCPRVFHADCVRPSGRIDVPLVQLRDPVPVGVEKTFLLTFDYPYGRVEHQTADSNAAVDNDDDPLALRQCIRCRLLERNGQHVRPLTTIEDLNEMLQFSFGRIRSWVSSDTFSAQELTSLHIPEAYVRLLQPILMQQPLTSNDITARIAANGYKTLIEYQVDIMDVLHCIGVLRGTATSEYEAAKYLHLDALHDITEMTRCQDCYKHSMQQHSDSSWFVRPCTVPHQLVHAKVPGFNYWPAKVIRKLHGAEGNVQYDVRFFGGYHERALVAERFVLPDGRPLALRKTPGLGKALAEMEEYKKNLQALATGEGDISSTVGAEVMAKDGPAVATKAMTNASQSDASDGVQTNKRVSSKKRSKTQRTTDDATMPPAKRRRGLGMASSSTDGSSASMDGVKELQGTLLMEVLESGGGVLAIEAATGSLACMPNDGASGAGDKQFAENVAFADSTSLPPRLNPQKPNETQLVQRLRRKMDGCPPHFVNIAEKVLREQLGINEGIRQHYEKEIAEIKSIQWCAVCLEPAVYYCCWCVSYCSPMCQTSHWKTHEYKCKRNANSVVAGISDGAKSTIAIKPE